MVVDILVGSPAGILVVGAVVVGRIVVEDNLVGRPDIAVGMAEQDIAGSPQGRHLVHRVVVGSCVRHRHRHLVGASCTVAVGTERSDWVRIVACIGHRAVRHAVGLVQRVAGVEAVHAIVVELVVAAVRRRPEKEVVDLVLMVSVLLKKEK